MPYKDLYFKKSWINSAYTAVDFATQPIKTALLEYAKNQARDYILNRMGRPLYDAPERGFRMKRRIDRNDPGPNKRRRMRRAKREGFIQTAGQYTGNFPFPSKRPKVSKSKLALRGSYGHHEDKIEAVTGQNVAYLGVSSFPRAVTDDYYTAAPMYHIAFSILRKLLKREVNLDIEGHSQRIRGLTLFSDNQAPWLNSLDPLSNPADNQSWPQTIIIWGKQLAQPQYGNYTPGIDLALPVDTISLYQAAIDNLTIGEVALKLAQKLCSPYYTSKTPFSNGTRVELYGISLRTFGDIEVNAGVVNTETAQPGQMRPIMRLDKQYINVSVKTVMYLQNQTKSDSDGVGIDVIDSNPIKGKIYYFKDPLPKIEDPRAAANITPAYKLMQDANGDGIIRPDMDVSVSGVYYNNAQNAPWTQLPDGTYFKNLSKYCNVKLSPGEMKKFTLNFRFNGLLTKFLYHMALTPNQTEGANAPISNYYVHPWEHNALGTCVLFAFEKRLSTGEGGVEFAFQRNVYTSAMLTGTAKIPVGPCTNAEIEAPIDNTASGDNVTP